MEVAAFIVSIIAILVSIGTIIYEKRIDKMINDINIDSEYFNELYKKILLIDIPQSRVKITYGSNGKMIGTEDFVENLKRIRQSSLYFYYMDIDFYKKLKDKLQEIEDYVLEKEDVEADVLEQANITSKINNLLEDLYDIMNKKAKGR